MFRIIPKSTFQFIYLQIILLFIPSCRRRTKIKRLQVTDFSADSYPTGENIGKDNEIRRVCRKNIHVRLSGILRQFVKVNLKMRIKQRVVTHKIGSL